MHQQSIRWRWSRWLLIPVSGFAMSACTGGVSEPDTLYSVDFRLVNVYSSENLASDPIDPVTQMQRPRTIPRILLLPNEPWPCCVLDSGASRVVRTFARLGDTLMLRACRTDSASGCDTNRCRVAAPQPGPLGVGAEFLVEFDTRPDAQWTLYGNIRCSRGLVNF
jgi:hypothetical protein